ncbi:hypothetical protein P9112_000990 [Eukaryota sp. TZLM1-RC]
MRQSQQQLQSDQSNHRFSKKPTFIQQRYKDIGLSLDIAKCLIIGDEPIDFFINDVNVTFIKHDHLLNCKHFITFRRKVHDAVRDQLFCMCKSHRIESFLEPLLSNLFDAEDDFHKNNRGDVILPGLDGSFILLDVMSVDPCNASNERLVNSEIHNPLSNAENFKFKKYNEPLSKLASLQHAKYNLYPFVFSLFGSLAPTALRFLDDFEMIVKRRTGRNFNRLFWQNRIVFSIFKGMLKMVSDALLSLGSHYERVASSVFVLGEMDFLDVDL